MCCTEYRQGYDKPQESEHPPKVLFSVQRILICRSTSYPDEKAGFYSEGLPFFMLLPLKSHRNPTPCRCNARNPPSFASSRHENFLLDNFIDEHLFAFLEPFTRLILTSAPKHFRSARRLQTDGISCVAIRKSARKVIFPVLPAFAFSNRKAQITP